MRPGIVMEENHIVHENPRALFPDGNSQTCECATIEVPPSTLTAIVMSCGYASLIRWVLIQMIGFINT
jgi:hypothetical protein